MNSEIRKYRIIANLSQEEMAKQLNITKQSYYLKECGKHEFKQTELINLYNILKGKIKGLKFEQLFIL